MKWYFTSYSRRWLEKDSSGAKIFIVNTLRRNFASKQPSNATVIHVCVDTPKIDGYNRLSACWQISQACIWHFQGHFFLKQMTAWVPRAGLHECSAYQPGCHSHSVVTQYWTLLHCGTPECRAPTICQSRLLDSLGMDRDSLSIFFVLFFICIHGVYTHLRQCTVYTYGVNGSRDWAIFLFFSLQSQSSSLAPSRLLSLTARPPFLLSQSLFLFKGLTKSLKKRGKCRFYRIGIGYNRKGQNG